MALDLAGYLTDNVNLTAGEKTAMLDDFCTARGYNEKSTDPETGEEIDNPVTKKQFFNQDLINYIKIMVNGKREKAAKEAAEYDELEI